MHAHCRGEKTRPLSSWKGERAPPSLRGWRPGPRELRQMGPARPSTRHRSLLAAAFHGRLDVPVSDSLAMDGVQGPLSQGGGGGGRSGNGNGPAATRRAYYADGQPLYLYSALCTYIALTGAGSARRRTGRTPYKARHTSKGYCGTNPTTRRRQTPFKGACAAKGLC